MSKVTAKDESNFQPIKIEIEIDNQADMNYLAAMVISSKNLSPVESVEEEEFDIIEGYEIDQLIWDKIKHRVVY